MVSVGMRENDVFDPPRIETEFFHAAEDFVLRRIVIQGLEDNRALVANDRPGIVNLRAKEIEIVGNLGRFCIPGFPGRRSGARGGGGCRSRRRRWNAETKKGARPLEPSR